MQVEAPLPCKRTPESLQYQRAYDALVNDKAIPFDEKTEMVAELGRALATPIEPPMSLKVKIKVPLPNGDRLFGGIPAWPRLTETLPAPPHPNHCQGCGRSREDLKSASVCVTVWEECAQDTKDTPEGRYFVLCEDCNQKRGKPGEPLKVGRGKKTKSVVEEHPRYYKNLATHAPVPGVMILCVGCAWRDGVQCTHPYKGCKDGPRRMVVLIRKPVAAHIIASPRSLSGDYAFYPAEAFFCSGREEEYAIEEAPKEDRSLFNDDSP